MRLLRWAFIFFQVVWLNAVLPGHTRGVVTLPGGSSASATSAADEPHGCCASSQRSPRGEDDGRKPGPEQRSRCAVCFFAAAIAAAPPHVNALAPLHLIERLATPTVMVAPSLDFPLTYLGRGPPGDDFSYGC